MIDCKVALQIQGTWYELEVNDAWRLYQRLSELFAKNIFPQATMDEQEQVITEERVKLLNRLKGR